MDTSRVWAEIDLDALEHNLAAIRRRAGNRIAVILVAKADAYGHGAVAIAHHAVRCGVAAIGVGSSAEALELRRAGVLARILVLGTIVDEEVGAALGNDVEIGLHSFDRCRRLQAAARRLGRPARVHLNIDTGMGLLGVLPDRSTELLRAVRDASHLQLAGVMTHVASGEGGRSEAALEQLTLFDDCLRRARRLDLLSASTWVHAANSACIFTDVGSYDAVRPGIAAYGMSSGFALGPDELRPVLSLRTKVVFLKDLPRGARVGYEGTWTAARRTRVATLPVGYNDGLPYGLANLGEVLVRGERASIIGRVSMDYATVDVTRIRGVTVGDVATLIGADGEERIRAEVVATEAGTIPYEITCSVGKRVGRVYIGGRPALRPTAPGAERASAPAATGAKGGSRA